MQHKTRTVSTLLSVFLIAIFIGALPAWAGQGQQPQEQPRIVGELQKVDTEAKMLTVVTKDGSAVEFKYTDATEVTGAQDSIAGLASAQKQMVAVTFIEDAAEKTRTATRIEVAAAQQR